jgi:hypothetical protein
MTKAETPDQVHYFRFAASFAIHGTCFILFSNLKNFSQWQQRKLKEQTIHSRDGVYYLPRQIAVCVQAVSVALFYAYR